MSFGFSVGDLIGAGNLTYQLIKALHSSQDAGDEYRAAINELGCMQQAFMRVSCLGANPNISQATFESASCIVMGSMDIIKSFLEKTKRYDRRLGGGLGMTGLELNLRKVGWTLFKADDMKKLRESLQSRLAALSVLLMAANLEPDGAGKVETFLEGEEQHLPASLGGLPDAIRPNRQRYERTKSAPTLARNPSPARTSHSIDSGIGSEDAIPPPPRPPPSVTPAAIPHYSVFSLDQFSSLELRSLITDPVCRSEKIKEVSELLRTLVLSGDCQLIPSDRAELIKHLDKICGIVDDKPKPPIKFKDAVGRKFSFPWHLCKTWKGMEELIKQAFLHVDVIGPHVHEGHYDLVGPDGEIILPQIWETMIQPDWAVTMHMWQMPDSKPALPPGQAMDDSPSTLPALPSPPPATKWFSGKAKKGNKKSPREELPLEDHLSSPDTPLAPVTRSQQKRAARDPSPQSSTEYLVIPGSGTSPDHRIPLEMTGKTLEDPGKSPSPNQHKHSAKEPPPQSSTEYLVYPGSVTSPDHRIPLKMTGKALNDHELAADGDIEEIQI